MENFWSDLIRKSGGEYNARFEFDNICHQLLGYHYPGRKLINANKIDTITNTENLLLVYLPKFFFDVLTNSRKSQIRKAFNHTLETIKDKDLKIFKWILCTPYKFNEEDLKWWSQWKYKNFDLHNIEIELLDGDNLLELIKKYNLTDSQAQQTQPAGQEKSTIESSTDTDLDFDFEFPAEHSLQSTSAENDHDETPSSGQREAHISHSASSDTIQVEEKPEQEQAQPSAYEPLSELQPELETQKQQKTTTIEKEQSQEADVDQKSPKKEQQPVIKLEKYPKIKNEYLSILASIDKLHNEEKEQFKKLRSISDFDYRRFKQEPDLDEVKGYKTLDLYFKAKTFEVDQKYDLALFFYELLDKRKQDLKNRFKNKAQEVEKSYREVERQLDFEKKILLGDLLLVKDKKLEALEHYEQALRLKNKNLEAKVKYNELLGDMLMESGLYNEAQKAYSEALGKITNRFKERKNILQKKRSLAKTMSIAASRVPLISQTGLLIARLKEIHNNLKLINAKEYMRLNRFLIVSGIILGIVVFGLVINNALKNVPGAVARSDALMSQVWDLSQAALIKGDNYMDKFRRYGYTRVHVLDSAKRAYKRAFSYNRINPIALKKYNIAKNYLDQYIKLAKRRLTENPGRYFRPVKPMSEGLQLVKYMYDPQRPGLFKFGYIDKNHNLVIPPLFDFDYNRRMKPGRESFHQGHAYVCIVVNPGDTAYFQINRYGRRSSKIYWVGPKHRYIITKQKSR